MILYACQNCRTVYAPERNPDPAAFSPYLIPRCTNATCSRYGQECDEVPE